MEALKVQNSFLDSLFTNIGEEATRFLMSYGRRLSFRPGDVIVREGEACKNIYIVLEGQANIIKNDAAGHSNLIAVADKGSVIGEMSVFIDMKRSASIIADTRITLLQIPKDDFIKGLQNFPSIPIRLLRSLSIKLQGVNNKLVQSRHNHHMLFIGMKILKLFSERGEPGGTLHMNLDAIAEHAGLLPLDLTNALLDYNRLGLVTNLKVQHSREASFQANPKAIGDFLDRAAVED